MEKKQTETDAEKQFRESQEKLNDLIWQNTGGSDRVNTTPEEKANSEFISKEPLWGAVQQIKPEDYGIKNDTKE